MLLVDGTISEFDRRKPGVVEPSARAFSEMPQLQLARLTLPEQL